jgi:hypothetical protein
MSSVINTGEMTSGNNIGEMSVNNTEEKNENNTGEKKEMTEICQVVHLAATLLLLLLFSIPPPPTLPLHRPPRDRSLLPWPLLSNKNPLLSNPTSKNRKASASTSTI